jgi:[acyl-carrier-protein] S-malonyltransferase
MGKDLAEKYPECRALFARADDVLGYKLSKICFEGPAEDLTKTVYCQPAIFVDSMACVTAFTRENPVQWAMLGFRGTAGLSLGEWTALHMAEALSFEDTLRILAARGRFMQEACEEREGGMVSVIGLPVEKLKEICAATGAEIANLNSADQTVLSGAKDAIAAAAKMATEAGARKAIPLKVAGAYHSSLMASAAKKLEATLEGVAFKQPRMTVLANATGLPHGTPDEIKRTMVKQVTSSVQWLSCVQWFGKNGIKEYLECGPGNVLSGLIKRIEKDAKTCNAQDVATVQQAVSTLGAAN